MYVYMLSAGAPDVESAALPQPRVPRLPLHGLPLRLHLRRTSNAFLEREGQRQTETETETASETDLTMVPDFFNAFLEREGQRQTETETERETET